jgi:diguanylate cyclase (GGDEF)-like protein
MRHLSAAAQTWIGLVLLGGGVAFGLAIWHSNQLELQEPALWILLVGACLAHAFPVIAPRHQAYHATQSVLMASVLLLSWPAVALVIAAAHIVEWFRRPRPAYIQLYNVATYLLSAGAGWLLLKVSGAHAFDIADPRALMLALLTGAILLCLNHGLTAIALWLARGIPPVESGLFGRDSLSIDGALLAIGIGMAGGLALQPLTVVVTASPLVLIYRALRLANVETANHRDQLTGLYNARHLKEALDLELRRAHATAHPTSVIVLLLDDVPAIVQRYGRASLDFLVLAVGDRLRECVSPYASVARVGEGSLGLLLPTLDLTQVEVLSRRLVEAIAAQRFALPTTRGTVAVTSSLAYASVAPSSDADAAHILDRVEHAAARAAISGPSAVVGVEAAPRLHAAEHPSTPLPVAASVSSPRLWVVPRAWLLGSEAAVAMLGLGVGAAVVAAGSALPNAWLAAGIIGLVVLSELLAFDLYDRSSFSVSFAPIVAAGLLGGLPATVLATCSVALVGGLLRRSVWHRVVFNAAVLTIFGVAATLVMNAFGSLQLGAGQLGPLVIGTALASVTYYLHTWPLAAASAFELAADPRRVWERNYRWLFPHYVLLGLMGLGLAVATLDLGLLGTALFLAPPLAMRIVLKQYTDRTMGAVHRLEQANAEMRAASAILQRRGEELSLLSDLGELVVAEPRTDTLPSVVAARCVPALGDLCAVVWQTSRGLSHSVTGASPLAATIASHSAQDALDLAREVSQGRAPDWARADAGVWLAAPLSGVEQQAGWLIGWTSGTLAAEDGARRLELMNEVAQRVALVLERDALLEESAELDTLRTVDRAKSDFIATTAHELRTPLTSLQGYTELLRTTEDPKLRERWLGIVHVEAAQLAQVVDQLLDVSRLDSGRFHADRRAFEVGELIARVTADFSQQALLTGHTLEIDAHALPWVYADPAQIERVLRNMLSNALKYSPAGGDISVAAAERSAGEVELCVQDHGLGIPSEWLGRLFERFQRVERPERAAIRGTGLGLYIARQLVELNGGRIWAASEGVGHGSTFHFTLPLARQTATT